MGQQAGVNRVESRVVCGSGLAAGAASGYAHVEWTRCGPSAGSKCDGLGDVPLVPVAATGSLCRALLACPASRMQVTRVVLHALQLSNARLFACASSIQVQH